MKINLILLAAGNSRRFGSNKLLYQLNGRPMFEHIIDEINQMEPGILAEKIVVTQYEEVKEYARNAGYQVVINPDSSRGISSSIHLGLEQGRADAYLFVVADQPYLKKETILGLLECFVRSEKKMASVISNETAGNPTIFDDHYRLALLQLAGDQGGRAIMKRVPDDVVYYLVEDKKELIDIDTR